MYVFINIIQDTEMSVHREIMDINYFGAVRLTKGIWENLMKILSHLVYYPIHTSSHKFVSDTMFRASANYDTT